MHLFRSILNAHFLRYVTLVIVACCGIFVQLDHSANLQNTSQYTSVKFQTTVFADDTPPPQPDAREAAIKNTKTTFIEFLNVAVAFLSFIYVPFAMLSSWLISPDWTFGDFMWLRPTLHALWVFISNTVYVVFAAMLIVVAIANIFGQSDSYAIKKMLPRFIIGVIMVPFTWWFVSATLSISSYMTALVLRMPADIITQVSPGDTEKMIHIPEQCTLDFTQKQSDKIWSCWKIHEEKFSEWLLKGNSAYGIIPLYAYNIFKFEDLDKFKRTLSAQQVGATYDSMTAEEKAAFNAKSDAEKSLFVQAVMIATTIGKVGIQLLMSVIFAFVFVILLVALVMVLFKRVIYMWMYAIFSPLFALKYFLSDKVDKESVLSKFDVKEFIGLALVPVVVSAALGFGFMFIMVFNQHMVNSGTDESKQQGVHSDYLDIEDADGGGNNTGSINFFGTHITVTLPENSSEWAATANDFKVALFNMLASLITPIFGIVILWLSVMAAMKTSAVTKEVVKDIEWFGNDVAGMAKKLPNLIPLGSVKQKDGSSIPISIGSLKKMPEILKSQYDKIDEAKRSSMRQAMGFDPAPFEAAAAAVKGAGTSLQENVNALNTHVFTSNRTAADMKSDGMIATLQEVKTNLKISADPKANLDGFLDELYTKLKANWNIPGGVGNIDFKRRYYLGGSSLAGLINTGATKIPPVKITSGALTFSVDWVEKTINISSLGVHKGSLDWAIQKAIADALKNEWVYMEASDLTNTATAIKSHLPPAPSPGWPTP